MRPIDKGEAPDVRIYHYRDAEPYLEERIGAYCSYCEFPIQHVPEVEHKVAKAKGGSKLAWANLLLSCKYCNARKHDVVRVGEKDKYIWPDEEDTFHCFLYSDDIPKLNENYLMDKESTVCERAEREEYFNLMLELAKATGFFSVWMDVFQGDKAVRQGLIGAFTGTRREYCDE